MNRPDFRSIRFWRRLVQCGVALSFLIIPILNQWEINLVYGNFISFNFGPVAVVDPMAALQVWLGSLSVTAKTLLGAGLILLLALLLGPVFCSWICPFGLISELTHGSKATAKNSPPAKSDAGARPFKFKLLLAGCGLLGVLFFIPFPILNQLSLPGWYSRLLQHVVMYGTGALPALWPGLALLLAVPALEKVLHRRFWCRWVCPQSLLLNLSGLLLAVNRAGRWPTHWPIRWQVRFQRKNCTCPAADRLCGKACSLNLDARSASLTQLLQCTNCGDCVQACKSRGKALSFGFGKTPEGAPPPQTPPQGD